jgi:hypothetical protein
MQSKRLPVLQQKETSRRGGFSHVPFICNDPSVQPLLPLAILGSERLVRKRDLNTVNTVLSSNVQLIRLNSS